MYNAEYKMKQYCLLTGQGYSALQKDRTDYTRFLLVAYLQPGQWEGILNFLYQHLPAKRYNMTRHFCNRLNFALLALYLLCSGKQDVHSRFQLPELNHDILSVKNVQQLQQTLSWFTTLYTPSRCFKLLNSLATVFYKQQDWMQLLHQYPVAAELDLLHYITGELYGLALHRRNVYKYSSGTALVIQSRQN